MNSYQKVKTHIFRILQDKQREKGLLEIDDISREVGNTEELIAQLGLDTFAQILSIENLLPLNQSDFTRMKKDLETHFDVKMNEGVLIQGNEQQNRDTTWWSNKSKLELDNYYWDRYKEYLKESLPPEVVKTIDDDTDVVMDNIENPVIDSFSRFGMVVGHVQSGKTANYSSLVCKAADAGYKFIVVIAGGINNLRDQTQERLNEAFVGIDRGKQVGVGSLNRSKLPISLTTVQKDFNTTDADKNSQGLNFDNINTPILLVIKKNTSTLTSVIVWLKNQYKNKIPNHAMLVIDDESDYASVNTNEEEDPTTINKKIRTLLEVFHKSAYVAYTATPYANIFIDHEVGAYENIYVDKKVKSANISEDLFPNDFIYALDAPSNYFGARKIFLDTNGKYLVPISDYLEDIPSTHKKDFELLSIPESLYEAMRVFVLNVAIRKLRGQGDKHNSMLIHATRFTAVHQKFYFHVDNYIESLKSNIIAYGSLPNPSEQSSLIQSLKDTFELRYLTLEEDAKPIWSDLLGSIVSTIESIVIREVHQDKKIDLEYRIERPTNAIVIGGTSLSRGYTLEGLSVSYFLRNTVFYDTLMQMGRWFGYRIGYQDLCKIYMSETMIDNFAQIIESTEDLMLDFKMMAKLKRTPNDFGLSVKNHPNSLLQVTAKNKLKNTTQYTHSMNLNGHLKETVRFNKDNKIHQKNFEVIKKLIFELASDKLIFVKKSFLWKGIDKSYVVDFLEKFETYQTDSIGAKNLMPIKHIQEYVNTIDTTWDIALYSGSEKEILFSDEVKIQTELRRSNYTDFKYYYQLGGRKLSQGNPEYIVLSQKDIDDINSREFPKGEKTKYVRSKLKNPILMLHILSTPSTDILPAFGICFPNNGLSETQTVEYTINKRKLQELRMDEESYDDK
ncbi:MAG: Endonuclease [uncultured Sulfurovum sp.]|uniref:Endonuclease n=1 Tax=uncultured Sulfurovum sp. TaxID=269237 RepID=A0A6S6SC92_9BACT|nr:MAG: Endonuclease [uncultured Sulfurovum sp.]